jgi:hypothetical protein
MKKREDYVNWRKSACGFFVKVEIHVGDLWIYKYRLAGVELQADDDAIDSNDEVQESDDGNADNNDDDDDDDDDDDAAAAAVESNTTTDVDDNDDDDDKNDDEAIDAEVLRKDATALVNTPHIATREQLLALLTAECPSSQVCTHLLSS